jgi:hypothetical protein
VDNEGYQQFVDAKTQVEEAIRSDTRTIELAENLAKTTMDYDTSLDILCKAYDSDIIRGIYGYTCVVQSDGHLQKEQLKAAIRSVGLRVGVWNERLKESETFFMHCPPEHLAVLDYIQDADDFDDADYSRSPCKQCLNWQRNFNLVT